MAVIVQIIVIAISVSTSFGNTVGAVDIVQRENAHTVTEAMGMLTFLENIGEALFEACCTLAAFVGVVLLTQFMKERGRHNILSRSAASKAKKLDQDRAAVSDAKSILDAPSRSISTTASTGWRNSSREGVLAAPPAQRNTALESDALAAAVRAKNAGELPQLLERFRQRVAARGANTDAVREAAAQHLLSALRACAANRYFREALVAYDREADHIGDGCTTLWSLLLYSAVEAGELSRCAAFFENLCASGTPSGNDAVNMVRYFVQAGDEIGLTKMLEKTRGVGFDIISRNRALLVCTSSNALEFAEILACDDTTGIAMDTVAYNTLIKGYAAAKNTARCSEIYASMRRACIEPSEMTFGILLDAFIGCQELDHARKIFADLRSSGLRMNVVHYTVFLKGLANAGHFEDATAVLDEMMCARETMPDLVTYSTLVKAHANHGKVIEAMGVLERMLNQGITPDAIIFNTVLTGCTVRATEASDVFHVFDRLVHHGLKTSTSTLSILLKALVKSSAWDPAFELLETAPQRLGMVPEFRLYTQLAQACASAGEGQRVVDAYLAVLRTASLRSTPIDYSTNARLCRLAASCGQAAPASFIHNAVKQAGGFLTVAEVSDLVARLAQPA